MKATWILLLAALAGAPAHASGISTNGGTPNTDQANVWFLGDEPVQYCVETSDAFSKSDLSALVRESIDDWIAFFRKHKLDTLKFSGIGGNRNLGLALSWQEIPRCTSPKTQVRFLFDVKTPEITRALELQKDAFGLSFREDYDHETFRTGGQVYVKFLPYPRDHLKHILLHELGHVFGMEHDSTYVMDARVADVVRGTVPSYAGFGIIESPFWPYRLEDGQAIELSANGRKEGRYEPNFVIVFLRDLFGFARDGYHSAVMRLKYVPGPINSWQTTLDFQDYDTGKRAELAGSLFVPDLHSDVKGLRGPYLYTNWACSSCNEGVMMYVKHLDGRPSGMDAQGTLQFGSTTLPALMEEKKGLVLRLYVPGKSMWWSTENYIGSVF